MAKVTAKAREIYATNPQFLEQAFALYVKGMSPENIATELHSEWPVVTGRTVRRIAEKYDWAKRKAELPNEPLLPGSIETYIAMKRSLANRIGALTVAEMQLLVTVTEKLLILTGEHPNAKGEGAVITNDEDLKVLLQIIATHRVLGSHWRKHKAEILQLYRDRVGAL
jgi:hypothetical protein